MMRVPCGQSSTSLHPRVHGRRHEPQTFAAELRVRERDVGREFLAQAREWPRAVALELDDVECELVVPRDRAVLELVRQRPGRGFEQLIGGGRHIESLAVDEHVLDLDAVSIEQAERGSRLS
jgi:hypothetical protein